MQQIDRNTTDQYIDKSSNLKIVKRKFTKNINIHSHEYYEIEYIVSGQCNYIFNGQNFTLPTGSLCFITPVDFHEFHVIDNLPLEIFNISFTEHWIDDNLIDILYQLPCLVSDMPNHNFLLSMLKKEYESELPLKWQMIRNIIEIILLQFYRLSHLKSAVYSKDVFLRTPLQQALIYMQIHYAENLNLQDVSRQISLCPNYFSNIFHKYTGETFQNYLSALRLKQAKKLLRLSDYNITEICFLCGFNSFSNFSRAFKNKMHMTPSQYRKLNSLIL